MPRRDAVRSTARHGVRKRRVAETVTCFLYRHSFDPRTLSNIGMLDENRDIEGTRQFTAKRFVLSSTGAQVMIDVEKAGNGPWRR